MERHYVENKGLTDGMKRAILLASVKHDKNNKKIMRKQYLGLLTKLAANMATDDLQLIIKNQMPANIFRRICETEMAVRNAIKKNHEEFLKKQQGIIYDN